MNDGLELDGNASISAGAPVFRAPRHELTGRTAMMTGGLVVLGRAVDRRDDRILAHERVHVLQQDFGRELWGAPLESWIATLVPGGGTVVRFVEPGFAVPLLGSVLTEAFNLPWRDRPWEVEAGFLEHR